MGTQEHTSQPYKTYADRIEREYHGEAHDWLVHMLRNGYHKGYRGGGCTVYVVDHEDEQVNKEKFDISRDAGVEAEFIDILGRPLSERGIRFVVVAYGDLYDLNFSYVDHIALTLDLEPSFLFAHFERTRTQREPAFRRRAPALRLSDARHLEFVYPINQGGIYSDMAVSQSVPTANQNRTRESRKHVQCIRKASDL